jgi:hypothetical protein
MKVHKTIKDVKQWYSNIPDLRNIIWWYLCATMLVKINPRNKSKEIKELFESVRVQNHFSMPKEQWQIGAAESTQLCQLAEQSWPSQGWVVDLVQGGCSKEGCAQCYF